MTLEFSNKEWTVLDAALDNRISRCEEMIDLFEARSEHRAIKAYHDEIETAKDLKRRLNKIFHSEI